MMKEYQTTLTKGYCDYWSSAKGIIELVSNGMDSHGEFSYNFDEENGSIVLSNKGVKLDPKTLLMGVSEKPDPSKAIGRFGVGMMQGICVILSDDMEVIVLNGDVMWKPVFKPNPLFNDHETLFVEEYESSQSGSFTIMINGVTEQVFGELKQRCLFFQESPEVMFSAPNCDVLGKKQQGNVYVAGVFVEHKPEMVYGYNFDVNTLKLNQDRESVNSWDLLFETGRVWGKNCPSSILKIEVKENIRDIQYSKDHINQEVKDELAQEWLENPVTSEKQGIIVDEYSQIEKVEENSNVKAHYLCNTLLTSCIKSSKVYEEYEELLDYEEEEKLTPCEKLQELFGKLEEHYNLTNDHEEEMDKILEEAEYWYD